MDRKTICIYGSFSPYVSEEKLKLYYDMGKKLGKKYDLIYGGGADSTLGYMARGMHDGGAYITGVYPKAFKDMNVFKGCDKEIVCDSMAERKGHFESEADVFIVLPGGVGTMDELFEAIVLIEKYMIEGKVIIFNHNGFYDTLLKFMDEMKEQGMFHCDLSRVYSVANTFEDIEEMIVK